MAIILCIPLNAKAQTWTSLEGPPKACNVKDIATNLDGQTVYICDKSFLFKSVNGGTSWAKTTVELSAPLVVACKPDVPNVVIVGIMNELKRNTTGGSESWITVLGPSNFTPLRLSVSPLYTDRMYLGRKYVSGQSSIMRSGDGGYAWTEPTTPPGNTDIYDLAPSPTAGGGRTAYVWACGSDPNNGSEGTNPNTAASFRGVWLSTDYGVNWIEKKMGDFNVRAIAFKSSGPIIFAGTASGKIYKTDDDGANWTPTTALPVVDTIRSIRIKNAADIYVETKSGIYKSTNNGVVWQTLMSSGSDNMLAMTIVPNNQNIMYATTWGTIWKTINSGDSWTEMASGVGRMSLSWIAVNGNNYWTATRSYDSLYRYNGSQWLTTEVSSFYSEHILRHPSNGYIYASGVKDSKAALYRSVDGGQTYSAHYVSSTQGSGNILKGTMVDPENNNYIYVWGKDGSNVLYRVYSDASRGSITVGNTSYRINDAVIITSSGPTYYAKESEGIYKCDGLPTSGTQVLSGLTVRSLAANSNVSNMVYAAGPSGLQKTNDGGTSWYSIHYDDLRQVVLSPGYSNTSSDVLIVKNDGTKIYYSSNGMDSWVEVQGNLPTPIYSLYGVGGVPSTLYAVTDQGIYKIGSPTGAPTLSSPLNEEHVGVNPPMVWNQVSDATSYHLQIATDDNFMQVVVDVKHISSTSYTPTTLSPGEYYWRVAANNFVGEANYSSVWSFITESTGTITLNKLSFLGGDGKFHPRLTWTHSGQGISPTFYIYRYSCDYGDPDCGVWPYPLIASTTNTTYDDNEVTIAGKLDPKITTFYYQVRSAGISNKVTYHSSLGNETKSGFAEIPKYENLPKEMRLRDNFPDPFNPVTTIEYDLSEDVYVMIKIYDLLGREVATLIDGYEETGYKKIVFDAATLSSGIYFYRMQAGKFTDVKKMLVIR